MNTPIPAVAHHLRHRPLLRHLHLLRRLARNVVLRTRQSDPPPRRLVQSEPVARRRARERQHPLAHHPAPARADLPRLDGGVQRVRRGRGDLPRRELCDARCGVVGEWAPGYGGCAV